eukprot:gene4228-7565_t
MVEEDEETLYHSEQFEGDEIGRKLLLYYTNQFNIYANHKLVDGNSYLGKLMYLCFTTCLVLVKLMAVVNFSWFLIFLPIWLYGIFLFLSLTLVFLYHLKLSSPDDLKNRLFLDLFLNTIGLISFYSFFILLSIRLDLPNFKLNWIIIFSPITVFLLLILLSEYLIKKKVESFFSGIYCILFSISGILFSIQLDYGFKYLSFFVLLLPIYLVFIFLLIQKIYSFYKIKMNNRVKFDLKIDITILLFNELSILYFYLSLSFYLSIEKYQNYITVLIIFLPLILIEMLNLILIYSKKYFIEFYEIHFGPISSSDETFQNLQNEPNEELTIEERRIAINNILSSISSLLVERRNLESTEENIRIISWLEQLQNQFQNEQQISCGLSSSTLSQLPTFKFMINDQNTMINECSICLSEYENEDEIRTLPCFHMFHKDCIDEWLKVNDNCPIYF